MRQILSLEYRRARDRINRLRHDLVRSVQRHPQDFTSLEVGIALNTVSIRYRTYIQEFSITYSVSDPYTFFYYSGSETPITYYYIFYILVWQKKYR